MQKLIWNGGGSGSYENPFKLEIEEMDSFDFTKPFNIHFKNNYEGLKEPHSYIKIGSKSIKYLLGIVITADGSTVIKTKDAVDKTLFLTNYVDAIDGGYYVSRYEGVNYIIRQQLFNVFEVGEVDKIIDHMLDEENPHKTSAHQVGAYTQEEVDANIEELKTHVRSNYYDKDDLDYKLRTLVINGGIPNGE